MPDLIDLAGRCVIVTGASSGIGASTARLLHAVGARPVLAARRADRLTALSRELDGALAVPTDVTDPVQVSALVAAALDRHQRIDGLVNNAGASLHGPLDQVDVAEFSLILQLNVAGLLAVTQAVLPAMREQHFGRIVNVSSGTTRRVAVRLGAYASSKLENVLFTRELARRWGPAGVAAAAAHPGMVRSRFGAASTPAVRLVMASPLAEAVADGRCVAEVAASHGVSWPTVQVAVAERAAVVFGEPGPTAVIGIDEARFGSPKRARNGEGRWGLTDPWETAIPALAGGQGLLGQVTGRTSAAVIEWLSVRSQSFRAAVQVVALDPSAPNAAAVRPALPHARVAVDHFHLVKLANDAVTTVRRRVTLEVHGRCGRKSDPAWANRRRLPSAKEKLSQRSFAAMWNGITDADPNRAAGRLDRQGAAA